MGLLSVIGGGLGFLVGGPAGALIGAGIGGSVDESKSIKKAGQATQQASDAAIAEQRAAREAFDVKTQPFLDIGLSAGEQLQSFLDDPNQGIEEINPIVNFFREQGFEQIQESAAAAGRLGAGGTLKDLTQFNTDLTSTIVPQLQNQRFNQLFNTASLGANVATGQGQTALQTGTNVSNLTTSAGANRASTIKGRGDALLGGVENIFAGVGAFPGLFGGTPPPSTPQASPTDISNALTGPF